MGKILKKLILVTSPPACGKTYVSKKLAENLKHVVYLDKDTLIPLSKQIFLVGNEEYNRSSKFFYDYIRDEEYEVILDLAFEALLYADLVLINAPFTKEVRDLSYIRSLEAKLKDYNAQLDIVWVSTKPEICKQRMFERTSDRDTWKLNNWDEYIKTCNFSVPVGITNLHIFNNNSEEEFNVSMKEICAKLEEEQE